MWGSTIVIFAVFIAAFLAFAVLDIVKAKKEKQRFNVRRSITAYVMLLPAILLAFLFVLLPILYSLGYAFTDFYLLKPNDINFIGFENFAEAFREIGEKGTLYHALINTLIFVVCVVPLQIGMALGLALFVNRPTTGAKVFKVCFFAPVVISLSVTSYLWLQILSPSETGLLNSFLGIFGAEPQDFLRNEQTAMLWIVLLSAWQGCGYQMLIFLSGLTNARKDLYEAASLDGANAWNKFVHVTMPALRPTLVYIIITVFIGACRVMTQPMLMIGYQTRSVTLSYYMYQQGYTFRWVGYSSAIALLMTIVMGTITLIQRRLLREK